MKHAHTVDARRSATLSPNQSGGSLKIGRPRSRSKSPFRSFRWKRGASRVPNVAADYSDDYGDDGGMNQTPLPPTQRLHNHNQKSHILLLYYGFLTFFRLYFLHTSETKTKTLFFSTFPPYHYNPLLYLGKLNELNWSLNNLLNGQNVTSHNSTTCKR